MTVHLDGEIVVRFYPDGAVTVDAYTLWSHRRALTGQVFFRPGLELDFRTLEDAFEFFVMPAFVLETAIGKARVLAKRARRVARQIARTTAPVVHYEPGSLQAIIAEAEGTHKKDGWPKGYMPL